MAIRDKFTIIDNIKTEIVDNSSMLISPYDVRHNMLDIVDSVHNLLDNASINTLNFATPSTRNTLGGELALGSTIRLAGYSSSDNSAFGYKALEKNFNGDKNTAVGSYSLGCSVFGNGNTAVGYKSIGGSTHGDNNVAVGSKTLFSNKNGSYNIAIGHGAGYYHGSGVGPKYDYKFYLGAGPTEDPADCLIPEGDGPVPLMYGELNNLRLAVGAKALHGYGELQVAGTVSPSTSGNRNLGHPLYPWGSLFVNDNISSTKDYLNIDDAVYVSGSKVGIGTGSPSGVQGLLTVNGNIVPKCHDEDSIGHLELRWKEGHYKNLYVHTLQASTFNHITECLYDCKTLWLATSGLCEGGSDEACGFLRDEDLTRAGMVITASGNATAQGLCPYYSDGTNWIYYPSALEEDCGCECGEGNCTPTNLTLNGVLLSDQTAVGNGIGTVAYGTCDPTEKIYLRSYDWTFKPSGDHVPTMCLEDNNPYSRNSWHSNISVEVASGSHIQTDRIIGRERLSLMAESGCFGVFMHNEGDSTNDNRTYLSLQRHINGTDTIQNKSNVNFLSSGVDYTVSYSSLTSGVVVGQRLLSRTSRIKTTDGKENVVGFDISYTDEGDEVQDGQKKNRLTISSYDDAIAPLNAFTLMRSNGPGLVGITDSSSNPLPNTIFNVQSTGDAVLRVTAPTSYDTSLQLLGRSNSATHGFDVTYDEGDERTDLSMISSSVKTKVISIKNNNVGVSYNEPDAKLSIGGDVSLTEYAEGRSATNNAGVGKLFVTQSSASEVEQNLVFQDDAGNKVNISKFIKDTTDGSVTYFDGRDNQFTGVGSPKSRATADLNDNFRNITYGPYSLYELSQGGDNLAIGYKAGYNTTVGSKNVFIGNEAGLSNTASSSNIAIGYQSAKSTLGSDNIILASNGTATMNFGAKNIVLVNHPSALNTLSPNNDNIIIGGRDAVPFIRGYVPSAFQERYLKVSAATMFLASLDDIANLEFTHSLSFFGSNKPASIVRHKETLSSSTSGGTAFTFLGSDGNEQTLLSLRHNASAMSNDVNYSTASPSVPHAELKGDLHIQGRIRFATGKDLVYDTSGFDVAGLIIGDTTNSRITIGVKTSDPNATVVVQPKTSTEVIQQWKDSTGRTVAYLDQNGNLHMDGDIIPF